ncbi:DNA primase [Asanoa sp. WMMD1127]|uniref:DNA primase n=1 Tax=Asanoa sp. WMMD1127 TaxID=3016107 RepID=UPI002416D6D2|nr:DNA primase [Asanoa sp. WMMD1127]MDG4822784.1 DNA primase [Asanoa sp. WMMD1127]
MARQSNRSKAKSPSPDEPVAEVEETTPGADTPEAAVTDEAVAADEVTDEADEVTDEATEADEVGVDPADHRGFWEDLRIDPVEIALPAGTGYTLRAYRMSNELTPTDTSDRDEDDPFSARARLAEEDEDDLVFTDEELAEQAEAAGREERRKARAGARDADEDDDEADTDRADDEDAEADVEAEEHAEEEEEEEEEEAAEEVPVFLTHRGKLLLFRSPEGLVSFIRSGAPHDLAQVDAWATLAERIEPVNVAPLDEDSYELDLVVENLRGGHDSWDPPLIIEAGEVARDLAYALRLPAVLDMLSPGSSLDDLDEALRGVVDGGIGGFMARRRLRKIGAQTASLGWRTIIGKISAAVDWRD